MLLMVLCFLLVQFNLGEGELLGIARHLTGGFLGLVKVQRTDQEVTMNTVTPKQIEFINRLQAERRWETTPAMATMVVGGLGPALSSHNLVMVITKA